MGLSWRSPGRQGGACRVQVMSPAGQGRVPMGCGTAKLPEAAQIPASGSGAAPARFELSALQGGCPPGQCNIPGLWERSSSPGKQVGTPLQTQESVEAHCLIFRADHKGNFGSCNETHEVRDVEELCAQGFHSPVHR